jgi:murein DD-endopeptidase MepM/ murein hydrolase activator NlpD
MRCRPALIVATVISALLLGLLGSAQAADEKRKKQRVDAAIDDLRHDLNETSQELRAAIGAFKRAEAQLPAAQAKVARVRGRLAAAQARDRLLADRLAVAEAEVRRAQRQIRATLREIAATHVLVGRIARSSYVEGGGGFGELAVVLDSQSPDDFATRLVLVQNAMRSEGAALGRLAESRAELAAEKATLDAKEALLADMKREQEALVVTIQGLEREAVAAQQRVEELIAERSRAVAAVEREKAAEERRYSAMQAESQRLQRILAERARQARIAAARAARQRSQSRSGGDSGGGGGSGSSSVLSRPAYGPITSPYGMRVHPLTGVYKLHDGTDFGVGCGTLVRAAASGTVIQAANVGGYGNQLVIDHGAMRGAGVATSYNHLMGFSVGAGTHVSRGQVIGRSGGAPGMYGAGYSTGCHLHFMVYVNGGTTDPMGWL